MEINPLTIQKHVSLRLSKEVELEEVGNIPLLYMKPRCLLRTVRGIEEEVYTTRCLRVVHQCQLTGFHIREGTKFLRTVYFHHRPDLYLSTKITKQNETCKLMLFILVFLLIFLVAMS